MQTALAAAPADRIIQTVVGVGVLVVAVVDGPLHAPIDQPPAAACECISE